MKAVGYIRVSTHDQAEEGASLSAQKHAITVAAKQRDIRLDGIIQDTASGKNYKRPGFIHLMSRLEAGEIDTVIVAKLDRFTRSLADFANTLELFEKRRWVLVALDMGLDMTTDTGRLMAHILGAFAEFERRRISNRTKEGLAQKRAEGVQLGRRSAISEPTRTIMYKLRLDGNSWKEIADYLTSLGAQTPSGTKVWSPSTVRYVCRQEAGV